jgi:hypothetical protein
MTLEEKIANAEKVEIYYQRPHVTKYAVVKYYCRKGKPLKVASYFIYGEEFKTGKPLICWHWQPSTNFTVLENNFDTKAEAIARMKEFRSAE